MNKRTFIQYISESNFKELFIREMGWNNPKGQTTFDVTIEQTTYEFQQIADRSGFQVLTCKVDDTPSSSMCKKIDTRLRRTANDYICIYHIPRSEHHLWVVPVKKVEKRDLVLVEYELASKADYKMGTGKQICYEESGYKCLEVPYVNNLKHGKEIYYNPDGRITKIVEYEEGKVVFEDNDPQNAN